jgi:hypothetical protein
VIGNIAELGVWDIKNAPKLNWNNVKIYLNNQKRIMYGPKI